MLNSRINSWLTLLANVGVVIGLALLIIELNESRKLAEMSAHIGRLDQMQQSSVEFANSEYLPEIYSKIKRSDIESLSPIEYERARSWERGVRLRMAGHYHQYRQGYLDQETGRRIVEDAADRMATWEKLGVQPTDPEFEAAVGERLTGR
jgi:hypothetical protein